MSPESDNVEKWIASQRRSKKDRFLFWKRRWRSAAIRILERILVGNSISNVLIPDISSLGRLKTAVEQVKEAHLLLDAQILKPRSSETLNFFPPHSETRRAIYRYVLSSSKVHLESGLANVCGGFIVEELFGHYLGVFSAGTVAHEYKLTIPPAPMLAGYWASTPVPRYYFHFVTQSLPTLLRAISQERITGIVVSTKMQKWAREALEALPIKVIYSEDKVLEIENHVCCSVAEIISTDDVNLLREVYKPFLSETGDELVFIGREGLHRNLGKLEDDVSSLVSKLGGRDINPASMTWETELRTFNSSTRVIMVYGSVTANVIWMKPGTKVLVLTNADGFTTQIEKYLFEAADIDFIEVDTSSMLELDSRLEDIIVQFARQ